MGNSEENKKKCNCNIGVIKKKFNCNIGVIKKKCNCNIGVIFLILIFAVVLFLIGSFISLFFEINPEGFQAAKQSNTECNVLANLGTIGDYFGGMINPLLAFASFCGLLYTIHIQRKELGMTKEELARSADAQEKSSAIFKQQQFETTFFSLLKYLDLSISEVIKLNKENDLDSNLESVNKTISSYRYTFDEKDDRDKLDREITKIKQFLIRFEYVIQLVFELLKLVDESNLPKEMYITLIKSRLEPIILKILFFSLLGNEKKDSLEKRLIEKYSIFEKLDFHNKNGCLIYFLCLFKDEYSNKAFLNNSSLAKADSNTMKHLSCLREKYNNHAN